jgi:hypothetical protein
MKPPEPNATELESALARLMPPALSPRAREGIEAMLDQLASTQVRPGSHASPQRWFLGAGIAASIGALISLWPLFGSKSEPQMLATAPSASSLVRESSIPLSVANQQQESLATYSGADGRVQVRSVGEETSILVISATGEVLFDHQVPATDSSDAVPSAWRDRVDHLRRSLDGTRVSGTSPSRQPQPRAVPRP